MTLKSKIGLTISTLITLAVSFITIRLSGHEQSLGILSIGLLVIDVCAIVIGVIFYATKLLKANVSLPDIGPSKSWKNY